MTFGQCHESFQLTGIPIYIGGQNWRETTPLKFHFIPLLLSFMIKFPKFSDIWTIWNPIWGSQINLWYKFPSNRIKTKFQRGTAALFGPFISIEDELQIAHIRPKNDKCWLKAVSSNFKHTDRPTFYFNI